MNILYIEDNPGDAGLLAQEFAEKAPSIHIDWIKTFREAIERLSISTSDNSNYDIVLTDMYLPDGNGISILSYLRDKGLRIPVVVITDLGDEESVVTVLKAGADSYIVKSQGYLYKLPIVLENAFNKVQLERERDALKTSEYQFQMLLENVSDLILVLDQEGILRYCSPSLERIMGFKPEEIIGRRFEEPIHPDDFKEILSDFPRIMQNPGTTSTPKVLRIKAKDGAWRFMEAIARSAVLKSGQPTVIVNSRDITDRKEAEDALLQSEKRFRTLVEKSTEAIVLMESSGKPLYVSPPIKALLGYSEQEFLTLGRNELVHPDDVTNHEEALANLFIHPQKALVYNIRLRHKNGTWRHIESALHDLREDPSVMAIIANVRDITTRKEAEDALHESEAKYRGLVENSLVGVSIIQDEKFVFVNKKFCEIHGLTYEEIMAASDVFDYTYPDDRAMMKENAMRILESKETLECDFRIIRKDNQIINVRCFLNLIFYKGQPAILGALIDTTRERLLESQLRQAHKMEAIGNLAGGIAHDFNNILTILTGYGTLLKMEMEKGLPLRKIYLDAILSAAMKATNLTQSLLTFSRQQPVSLKPVKINEVIMSTEKILGRLLTEDISLKTNLSSEEITVMADQTQLDQILINLVVNARDAMPTGGTITIDTRLIYLDSMSSKIKGLRGPGHYALLSVIDTGIGMDDNTKEHIFEPFFTTKEVGKGTGLGLFSVYGIIKQHNGYITVYSEKSMGTTFHIYLPITEAVEEPEQPHDLPPGGTETLLLAEDNEEVRNFMTTVLSQFGYSVIEAVDGEDAIERFKAQKGISLLILDSVMPKKNGRLVYDEISSKHPQIKVIFMSGYTRDVVLDKGIEDKKFDFMAKPVSPDTLLRKVREVLDR